MTQCKIHDVAALSLDSHNYLRLKASLTGRAGSPNFLLGTEPYANVCRDIGIEVTSLAFVPLLYNGTGIYKQLCARVENIFHGNGSHA